MCGMCAGVPGCAQVCLGVRRCERVCGGVPGCARVCTSVRGCAWVCAGVYGCAQLCVGVRRFAQEYTYMCGMNFQNFFRRIESLHQQTLIRILFEFLSLVFQSEKMIRVLYFSHIN